MNSIRLGIATADGLSVCDHLARSTSFLILELEDGRVASGTVRTRSTGQCGHHKTFVDLLDGCQAVVCGGIGQGAVDSLTAHGIEPLVVTGPMSIDDALKHYLAGTLPMTAERVCLCG
ncbi:MAG TPA: NifB/NifX family molybdenum-iron cluster-binding protein [Bryobacteraceae bacterium]|nr:NifB/NifX family molybdenum-iron cluster-binding protein [Bryobacteraceae bacterium]